MAVGRATESPLVGRGAAVAEVASALEAAQRSRGALVLVTGPAGIGKTRLAEETCARSDGFRVVWSWCGGLGDGSLHPWRRVVRALAADDARVSRLVNCSPYFSDGSPGSDAQRAVGEATSIALEQRQLISAVSEILEVAARSDPLLLVLDDLHDAGPSSLELLAHVVPSLRTERVVVLATARDDDFAWRAAPTIRGTLMRHAHRVSLDALSDGEVGELIESIPGAGSSPGVARLVARRTGGNPLFVVELVRLLGDGADGLATKVPFSVEAIVAERTSTFDPRCRDLLSVAAVLGTRFRLDVLADAANVPLAEIRALIGDAERAAMVIFDKPGQGRFTHDLVRDAIYGSLPAPERVRWHERIGSALVPLAHRGRGVGAAEVASHLLLAGPGHAARAATFAQRAGDDSRRVVAYEDAVRWYEQAAECLDAAAGDDQQLCEVLLALGEARLGSGDRDGTRAEFLRVADVARAGSLPAFLARAALGLGSGPAGFEVDALDRQQLDLLDEARGRLPAAERSLRAFVAARLSVALSLLDTEDRRHGLAVEAIALAREAGDERSVVYALSALCDAQAGPDHCADRLRYSDEMIDLAVALRDSALELLARRFRVVALLEIGDIAAADAEMLAFRTRAKELRHPLYEWYGPLWHATRALMEGRFAECEAANAEAEAIGVKAGSTNATLLCVTQRWCLVAEMGDRAGVEALMHRLDDAPLAEVWVQVVKALISAQLGRLEHARRSLDAVAPRLVSLPRDSEWLAVLAQVAETVALIGTHPVSGWVYDALLPYSERYVVEGIGAAVRGPVQRHLGLLAAASGRMEVARDHFITALIMSRAVGATQLVARIEAESAATVPARGPRADQDNEFRRDGELWILRFAGLAVRLPDAKGVHDLAQLLGATGREIAALDLAGIASGGDTGPILDVVAREAYRRRLQELEDDIAAAETMGDAGRVERFATERDALVEQLTTAFGLGGRTRRAGSPAERARTTVTARIRHAIRRIEAVHPELGRHLDRSVRTGTFCSYRPEPPISWKV